MRAQSRGHGRHQDTPPSDHLEDLRAQLPAAFRDASDSDVARLWVALDAARHGHGPAYLAETFGLPEAITQELVAFARNHR